MEYQVRDARITDVDRITTLLHSAALDTGDSGAPLGSADLLRQLVYLPQAVVLVAESRRIIVGATVLALRPSVRQGGFVGTLDVIVVQPEYEAAGVIDSLVAEALRSARNKGCVAVEAAMPDDPGERSRWAGYGFVEAGPHLVRELAPMGAARRG
ncbi:MAG TPA: GNAT family N-acetyltransferase [Candidatus Limnocylindrales bacterium]|nr:GNAT family N-acetyltransferase [Candidatus Limnocylindrales bacterium]